MVTNNVENYINYITPKPGDPTYSILKAHLLFEELLRAFLSRTLPHPEALEGSRLTFLQLLSVAQACSAAQNNHWCWIGLKKLNKLRNMLSHETTPKDLADKTNDYVKFITDNSGIPLPAPPTTSSPSNSAQHGYLSVDLVTVGLYYYFSNTLGFDTSSAFKSSE